MDALQDHHRRAQEHLERGELDAAASLCAGLRRIGPNDASATFRQGQVAWGKGMPDIALSLMRAAMASGRLGVGEAMEFGARLQESGRMGEAGECFAAVLRAAPGHAEAKARLVRIHGYLGSAFYNLQEMGLAFSHYATAIGHVRGAPLAPALLEQIRQGLISSGLATGEIFVRIKAVTDALLQRHGHVILAGPFVGMRLWEDKELITTNYVVGSYEDELDEALRTLLARRHDTLVNVGVASGYYAVGLARLMPGTRVVGFETEDKPRQECATLARLNGVEDRIELHGAADPANFGDACRRPGRTLVFMDCEGFEEVLLDPERVPELASVDILVECHDFAAPGVTETLRRRLSPTHTLTAIAPAPKHPDRYPLLDGFPEIDRWLAVAEARAVETGWLLALAR